MSGNEGEPGKTASTIVAAPLLAPLFLLSTLAMTAPLKVITGWSSIVCLAAATVLAGAAAAIVFRLERPLASPSPRMLLGLLCGAALIGALMVRLLYNPHVFGMVNTAYQPDAGTHVAYSFNYGASRGGPAPYSGFVGFHMAAYWLATIFRLTPFSDFRLLFYLNVLAWPLALAALAGLVIPRRASAIIIAIALTLFAAPIAFDIVVPIFHELQALAAYPELFGLIPMFLCWAGYAGCRSPVARLLCVGISAFVLRYVYGLNVGDLLATLVLLSLVEATELRGALRRALAVLIAVGLALVAHEVYTRLWLLHAEDGPRPHTNLDPMASAIAQLIGALALLLMPAFLGRDNSPVAARVLRFAALFGASTAFVQLVYLHHGPEPRYYFFRYQLYGPIIIGTGLVLAAVAALVQCSDTDAPRWRGPVALAFTVIASVLVLHYSNEGIVLYRGSAHERAYGRPPFRSFLPLCDVDAARVISRVLRRQNKAFGGFFSYPLPYMFFMDQQFHGAGMSWPQFFYDPHFTPGGRSLSAPGYCFFWDHPSSHYWAAHLPWAAVIEHLEQEPNRNCYPYAPRYQPEGTVARICSVCN